MRSSWREEKKTVVVDEKPHVEFCTSTATPTMSAMVTRRANTDIVRLVVYSVYRKQNSRGAHKIALSGERF